MSDLFGRSDNTGLLDCGCRISLVVSATPPRGQVNWCATHRGAHSMRQCLNLLRGFAQGAQGRILDLGISRAVALGKFKEIEQIITRVLLELDPLARTRVQNSGPGEGGI